MQNSQNKHKTELLREINQKMFTAFIREFSQKHVGNHDKCQKQDYPEAIVLMYTFKLPTCRHANKSAEVNGENWSNERCRSRQVLGAFAFAHMRGSIFGGTRHPRGDTQPPIRARYAEHYQITWLLPQTMRAFVLGATFDAN